MAKNCSQDELKQWFENEKTQHGLVDIKFFPYVDVQTSVESFSRTVLDVLKAEESERFTLVTAI